MSDSTLEDNIEAILDSHWKAAQAEEAELHGEGYTLPEDMTTEKAKAQLLSLYQKELVRDTARLRADLASAMGHMQGCGHTYEYLVRNYPELQGKLTGEQP